MLYYGKSRIRTNRVLFVLALGFLTVGSLSAFIGFRSNDNSDEVAVLKAVISDLEDERQELARTRAKEPLALGLIVESPSQETNCASDINVEDFQGLDVAAEEPEMVENIGPEMTQLALEETNLKLVFPTGEPVLLKQLLRSWELALGKTILLSPELEEREISLSTTGQPSLSWSKFKLMLEMMNLAVKYDDRGAGHFHVSARP